MGIDSKLEEVINLLKEKNEDNKSFKLPFGKKVGKSQLKKNYVTVIKLNENSHIDFQKVFIDEQTILIDGIPRLASAGYVFNYKGNPTIILPSWSVEPLSASKIYTESLNDGSNVKGYKILMAKMEKEIIKPRKELGGTIKLVIGLGVLALIGYALLTGGG